MTIAYSPSFAVWDDDERGNTVAPRASRTQKQDDAFIPINVIMKSLYNATENVVNVPFSAFEIFDQDDHRAFAMDDDTDIVVEIGTLEADTYTEEPSQAVIDEEKTLDKNETFFDDINMYKNIYYI